MICDFRAPVSSFFLQARIVFAICKVCRLTLSTLKKMKNAKQQYKELVRRFCPVKHFAMIGRSMESNVEVEICGEKSKVTRGEKSEKRSLDRVSTLSAENV